MSLTEQTNAVKTAIQNAFVSLRDKVNADLASGLAGKVDSEVGKGLSSNDYTDLEKTKLAGIEDGAQVNTVQTVDGQTGAVDLSGSYEAKRQNNLSATTDPTATDDDSAGYELLSRWINTSTGEIWLCVDATAGAANWQKATLSLDELGSAALADVGTGETQLPRNSDLGSAASAETTDFEVSGAVATHEAAADPHSQYVQKVVGKDLSTEDYTTAEKENLANLELMLAMGV